MTDTDDKMGDELELRLAEYALGTLPLEERRELADQLSHDAAMTEKLARWEEQLYPLSDRIDPVEPPPGIWENIRAVLFADDISSPVGFWNRIEIWRGLAFASMAAVAVVSFLWLNPPVQTDNADSGYLAEVDDAASGVRLIAHYEPESGTLRLRRTDGDPASGRDFELWIVAEDTAPISLGVLPKKLRSVHTIPVEVRPHFNDTSILAVSDEPSGGSQTGQPTGAILASGRITHL